MKNFRKNQGITLIALVITVIVLLILAGVTISTLTGENGILTRAQEAKNKTEEAQKEEQNTLNSYEDKINEYVGIDWNTALANAQKHPDQKTNTAIGVGTDGKSVNMDLWEFTLLDDGTYALNDIEAINGTIKTSGYNNDNIIEGKIIGTIPQYIKEENENEFKAVTSLRNTFIENTNLKEPPIIPTTINSMYETFARCSELTEMPEIPNGMIDMTSTFYNCINLQNTTNIPNSVTIMNFTFNNCSKITAIHKLPENLETMRSCFQGCSKLLEMPDIPENVVNMQGTFWGCSEITEMKKIPSSVTNISDCFRDCIKLRTASTIPNSVTNMRSVFRGCSDLQGVLEINANLTGKITEDGYEDYLFCLTDATTNEGITLQIIGSCTILDKIIENANNPNITLGI